MTHLVTKPAKVFGMSKPITEPEVLPPIVVARGTREWVKGDHPLGTVWYMEYAMFCLGHGFAVAGACEFYYRLGKAHHEFEALRTPKRSIVSG